MSHTGVPPHQRTTLQSGRPEPAHENITDGIRLSRLIYKHLSEEKLDEIWNGAERKVNEVMPKL